MRHETSNCYHEPPFLFPREVRWTRSARILAVIRIPGALENCARRISMWTVALGGGQVEDNTQAPFKLTSRVTPSPLKGPPLDFSQVKITDCSWESGSAFFAPHDTGFLAEVVCGPAYWKALARRCIELEERLTAAFSASEQPLLWTRGADSR